MIQFHPTGREPHVRYTVTNVDEIIAISSRRKDFGAQGLILISGCHLGVNRAVQEQILGYEGTNS
jgi:hypothetical protein